MVRKAAKPMRVHISAVSRVLLHHESTNVPQVLDYFDENFKATADSLGDPQRETPEELQSRHERVLASTLLAAAAVTDVLVSESGACMLVLTCNLALR